MPPLPALPAPVVVTVLSTELEPPAASSGSGPTVLPPQAAISAKPSETERERRDARRCRAADCRKKAINTPPERGILEDDGRTWNTFL
jgi:hypothetical protein